MRTCVEQASSRPPPTTAPWSTATTGTVPNWMRANASCHIRECWTPCAAERSFSSARSRPAQKCAPAPCSTTARQPSGGAAKKSRSPSTVGSFRALRFAARSRRRTPIASWRSKWSDAGVRACIVEFSSLRGRALPGFRFGDTSSGQAGRELRIGLGDLVADRGADQREHVSWRFGRVRHGGRAVEIEAGVGDDLLDRMPGVDALEREALPGPVEREQPAPGKELPRPARPVHAGRARSRRRNEIDLRHEDPRRVLLAEQDHFRYEEVEIGRAVGPGPAHVAPRVRAGADEVDVRLAVDLTAAEEERVDTTLRGAVEGLDAAVGEVGVLARAQDRQPHRAAGELAREERRRPGDRRRVADDHVAAAGEQPRDGGDQDLGRRNAHWTTLAPKPRSGSPKTGEGALSSLPGGRPGGLMRPPLPPRATRRATRESLRRSSPPGRSARAPPCPDR